MRKLPVLLLCLALALVCGAAALAEEMPGLKISAPSAPAEAAPAEAPRAVTPLPIDFSPGYPPAEDCFDGMTAYHDPSIDVEVSVSDRKVQGADIRVWIATIRIADASQLRTAPAESYDTDTALNGVAIARRMKAVVAMDGDYYGYHSRGFILRQGQVFRQAYCSRDVLLIDEDGDFHVVQNPYTRDLPREVDGKAVINALYFGPGLVINGKVTNNYDFSDMDPEDFFARIALCQIDHLTYKVIATTGQTGAYFGIPMADFARLCRDEGAQIAYGMDGGNSTLLYFHGEKLNEPENPLSRDLMDIVYFASAWSGEE